MQNVAEVLDDKSVVQEALENFAALLEDADFTAELELMGIGRMQFMRRRQMLVEWRGLYMALWRLALSSSFPQDAEHIFATFLHAYRIAHPDKLSALIMERAQQYWGMLQPTGDADFSDVARHLGSFSVQDEKQARSLTLRLVLHIRRAYKIIFDRLI